MALFSSTQPSLRARVLPRFPARVVAGSGINIVKSGNTYTFSVAQTDVQGRELLTEDRTYYVSPIGDDSNSGLAPGEPFLTIQQAADTIVYTLDLGGNNVTVQVADGSYTAGAGVFAPVAGGGGLFLIQGNTSSPANVIISTTDDYCFVGEDFADFRISGMELRCGGSGGFAAVAAFNNSVIRIGDSIRFGQSTNNHHIQSSASSLVYIGSDYSIVGGASFHYHAFSFGVIACGKTVTLSGSPAFNYFAYLEALGYLQISNGSVYTGVATGRRYNVDSNATIFLESALSPLSTFFPGDQSGIISSGGIYLPLSQLPHSMVLVNGANNDIATIGGQEFARITGPTGAFSVSGFVSLVELQRLTIYNSTSQNMTITNDATSSAANRILTLTGADVVLTGASSATFVYSTTDLRWILVGTQP